MTRLIVFEIEAEEITCGSCRYLARLRDMQTSTWCDLFRTVLENASARCEYYIAAEQKLPDLQQLAASEDVDSIGICPRCGERLYETFIAHDDTCKNSIYKKSL